MQWAVVILYHGRASVQLYQLLHLHVKFSFRSYMMALLFALRKVAGFYAGTIADLYCCICIKYITRYKEPFFRFPCIFISFPSYTLLIVVYRQKPVIPFTRGLFPRENATNYDIAIYSKQRGSICWVRLRVSYVTQANTRSSLKW
jgi:hypothetical protein